MNFQSKITVILSLFLTTAIASKGLSQDGEIHALLVGVTKYTNLTNAQQLDGPINDVKLVRETLIERYESVKGELKKRIVMLHEGQPDELKPTYANIAREFVAIADRVSDGDQVFILLSGHGSQDLDDADDSSDDYEADGLDEVFLPSDVKGWNEKKHMVEGAIRDDQMNEWLNAIQAKGATVVFVSDSCHSNTQTRGASDEEVKTRRVDLVPKRVLEQRVTRRSRGGSSEKSPFEGAPKASRIGFFAAQTDETTPDSFRLPGEKQDTKDGLLAFTFCQVLKESQGPITYREMGQLIHKKYQYYRNESIGRNVPTPAMSGTDLDRVVLGNQWRVGRSRLTFKSRNGMLELSGGSIDGLTSGTILQLFPEAGSAKGNQALGFARVDSVKTRTSKATPVEFDEEKSQYRKSELPKSLTEGRCEIHQKDYGQIQLTAALDASFERHPAISQQITELGQKESTPFKLVDAKEAEFLLSAEENNGVTDIVLTRTDKTLATVANFDLGPLDNNTIRRVEAAFKRIGRAKSLTDLATRMPPFNAANSQYGGNVSVEVVAEMGTLDEQGVFVGSPVDLASGDSLQVDAQVMFHVKNHSASEVNVTLLYVSDSYQIAALMPSANIKGNTIEAAANGKPGQSLPIGPFPVETHSRMAESIVVIATRANETMTAKSDYTYLAQRPLNALWSAPNPRGTQTASRGPVSTTAWDTTRSKSADQKSMAPLDRLLDDSGFNPSKSRSLGGAIVKDHSIGIVTWKAARPQRKFAKPAMDWDRQMKGQFFQSDKRDWSPDVSRQKTRGSGESVYPKVAPSVVVVRTSSGYGTGFVISDDGWILTNHHVVSDASINPKTGARTASVNFGKLDGGWMNLIDAPVDAEIYKWDKDKDLALLKLMEMPKGIETLSSIAIADSIPRPGADCIAIGHPSSGTLWTLRTGELAGMATWPSEQMDFIMERMNVRAANRGELETFLANAPKQKILYSTCGLNTGDSGGPLVNKDGQLIAINFAIPAEVRDDKFSFHVHLSEVKQFIKDKPESALIEKPQSDEDWSGFQAHDLTYDRYEETVFLESDSNPNMGFLVDLDEDSDSKLIHKVDSLKDVNEIWDAELAVYSRNGVECFYDTDNDGEFDLWLVDSDQDTVPDSAWIRKPGSDWKITDTNEMKMFDIEHFKSNKKKMAKPFDKTTRAIVEFLVN